MHATLPVVLIDNGTTRLSTKWRLQQNGYQGAPQSHQAVAEVVQRGDSKQGTRHPLSPLLKINFLQAEDYVRV